MQDETILGTDPKLLSPGTLAFMGDAVYELYVRQRLVERANMPVNKLHGLAVEKVRASFQSKAYSIIEEQLSEEEQNIWKRGRNANNIRAPKNADLVEYRRATGLEALFGYLFLQGRKERLEELFELIWTGASEEQ